MSALRDGLLQGATVRAAGSPPGELRERLSALGATVAGEAQPFDALLVDARGWFAGGGDEALRRTLDEVWQAVQPVAAEQLIPAQAGGRILLIAPSPDAGPLAAAARDALENLARTLSVEWARFRITSVAIAPGARTREDELAELVAYLLSRAGGYFSGCRLDLR